MVYYTFGQSELIKIVMSTAELKLKFFRQIDLLDKQETEEAFGILLNYLHGKDDTNEWGKLTEEQQDGILEGVTQLNKQKGIPQKKVIEKYRKKYHA